MKPDKLLSVLAIVLSVSLASCGKPDGDSDLDGKIISELTIRYPTPKYVQEGRLLQLIASQPGTVYSSEKVDDDVRAVWESGLVDDVKFSVKPDGEKIHLIADVTTRPGSGPVLIKGNRLFSDQRLFKQISEPLAIRVSKAAITEYDKVTDERIVYEGNKFESEVLPGVCRELESFYASRGHPGATVICESWDGAAATSTDFVFVISEPAGGG